MPRIVGETEDCEGGPVNCNELLLLWAADRWHCEGEDGLGKFVCGVPYGVRIRIKFQTFVEVFATKATDNHYAVGRELSCSKSLTSNQLEWVALWIVQLYFSPLSGNVFQTQTNL